MSGIDDQAARVLERARTAYRRREWASAREGFAEAARRAPLGDDDLLAAADAAWWLGLVEEFVTTAERAYRCCLEGGEPKKAAMIAVGAAVTLFLRGEDVVGSGWISRAQRILANVPESAEHGYLRYVTRVEAALDGPDLDDVVADAREVAALGRRHGDPNLVAAGTLGEGRAVIRQGRVAEGMALLDEAMLSVLAGDLTPDWAGNVYCHLMAACWELADIHRAAAWTKATARWLETLPDAVLFTGICRVHRSQVLQVAGAWEEAEREAARVCADLRDIHVAAAAEGHYQVGELRRLRGDLSGAEAAYEEARRRGRDPQPGLALLLLARNRPDAAAASLQAALAAVAGGDRLTRSRLRSAQVRVALAAGDLGTARQACEELESVAQAFGTSGLVAGARHARGAVLLAERRAQEAVAVLGDAWRRWRDLDAPYEKAQVEVLLAVAHAELGDVDSAERGLEAAVRELERLGASADAVHAERLRARSRYPAGLTAREAQVLSLVAAGLSNREVAEALVLSDRTVARHLSNIFTKLGVTTRTAAAAYAFEHGLTTRPRG